MIGNDLEIEIIELFRKDITRLLTINQIAKELRKAYPYIHKKVTSFIEKEIFNKFKLGNSTLCSINLQSEEAIVLLTINELKQKKELLKKNKELELKIEKLKEASKEVPIQTVLKVKNKLFIITENQFYKKTLHNEFSTANIMTKQEFQQKILKDYSQIQDHILLYHNEKYYEIMGEIEHELRIKNFPITK
ncbi:MAG: hypothetical protein ABH828_03405 [archaeon]